MLSVEIHRDLTRYRAKVVGGLTARSLAFTCAALATGVAAYGLLTWVLGLDFEEVSLAVYAATVPLWALGFLEPAGMRPERWLPLWLRQHGGGARLTYGTAARFAAAADEPTGHETTKGGSDAESRAYRAFARRQRGIELWCPGTGA